jgi:bifunctional non-homologous end joining protein LigD
MPLNTPTTYGITQPLAQRAAEALAEAQPDLILSEMARGLRPGKVFIDWSQNAWHKTTVGVYSVRAKRERAFVSMPVKWAEVETALESGQQNRLYFEPDHALARVQEVDDLFEPVLHLKQQLPAQLLRKWGIDTTVSEKKQAARSAKPKPQTAAGLPRSGHHAGRQARLRSVPARRGTCHRHSHQYRGRAGHTCVNH